MPSDQKLPAGAPSPKLPAGGGKDSSGDRLDGPPVKGTPPADRPSKG